MVKNTIKNIRIFHGPENICGRGKYLADWQRENKNVISDCIVYDDNSFNSAHHKNFGISRKPVIIALLIKVSVFFQSIFKYDLFHFYFGKSLLPLNLDLPFLRLFRKKIIMNYVGSDIRLVSLAMKRNPYYHLLSSFETKKPFTDTSKILMMLWHRLWVNSCFAVRELRKYAEKAYPSKMIISDIWATRTDFLPEKMPEINISRKVKIIHAPSNQTRKGTLYIQYVMDELSKERNDFEFRMLDKVPHNDLINIIKNDTDIVIDQLLIGDYGNISVEAMSFSKTVCCFILDEVYAFQPDLPIVNCTINNLKEKLDFLISYPEERVRIGEKGWIFVMTHFEKKLINEKIWKIYQNLF